MLPRSDHPHKSRIFFIFAAIVLSVILGLGVRSTQATHLAPTILEPERNYPIVTGFQSIEVYDSTAETLDIFLYLGAQNPGSAPCYTIAKGLTFDQFSRKITYNWDSTTVVDSDEYMLFVVAHYEGEHVGGDAKLIRTENGKTGDLCSPPFEPPLNPPPPTSGETSDPAPSEPDISSQPSSSTTQSSEANQPKITATENEEVEKPIKQERKDALVIFDEEVPIELDRFDPDIFLKGENLEITKVSNSKVENNQVVQFAGKTSPNTLVTLYIFSSPVVVVVKSNLEGNWEYNRETQFESGKHTVFATIYDEGVTRRSETIDFFVARGTREGQSLILSQSSLQNFYPYIFILGFAVVASVLILIIYRIYNKRKQMKP